MKIAAFDSGIGGLTAIAPLLKKFPEVSVTYLGDLANLPYGPKSPSRIRELTEKNITWLIQHAGKPDLVLVACNTASAHALEVAHHISIKHGIPCLGVLDPGCKLAVEQKPKRIVVLATSGTVKSEAYSKKIRELGFKGELVQKACPLFVPLVEDHLYKGPAVEWIAENYLKGILLAGDQVILGCTHYPFLRETLVQLFPDCSWIEAGEALLKEKFFQKLFTQPGPAATGPRLEIFVSDPTANLQGVRGFVTELGLDAMASPIHAVRVED